MLSFHLSLFLLTFALSGLLGISSQTLYQCPSPRPEVCTTIVSPACGWFDPAQVQCFVYPCAINKPNPCNACQDKTIKWVSCGNCPEVASSRPSRKINTGTIAICS